MALTLIIVGFLSLLFGLSGLQKLRRFGTFKDAVLQYQLIPAWATGPAACGIVLVELAVPTVSVYSLFYSLLLAASLLALYASGIAVNLVRGRSHIDCGCNMYAADASRISWGLVVRNLCLIGLAAVGMVVTPVQKLALSGHWLEMLNIAACVGVFALVYMACDFAIQFNAKRGAV